MLPSPHDVPISVPGLLALNHPRQLADAFSEFISASAQLEASYRGLQQKVAYLSGELADRNAALTSSLAENDRIRTALQQMIDSLPCGVLVDDPDGAIITVNPEARRLLGIADTTVASLRALSQTSHIDFEALAAAQSDSQDTELRLSAEGGECWVAVRRRELFCSTQARNAAAPHLRGIWILRDVTATRCAEREREASRRAATLAEISSILAHEIRNPLASLELFAELIADDPAGAAQWIAHLRAGIRTLSGTVNNVLSLNGENHLRFSRIDLSACIEAAVEFVRPMAEQANVALRFFPAGREIFIRGNNDALRQIILNLSTNAIRHTPADGKVYVSVRREEGASGDLAVVEVSDTGCGIPEEQMSRLFEAGFSGTGQTPGLGLAVCRRLMKQHNGTIRATSRANEGSRFFLEFPER